MFVIFRLDDGNSISVRAYDIVSVVSMDDGKSALDVKVTDKEIRSYVIEHDIEHVVAALNKIDRF